MGDVKKGFFNKMGEKIAEKTIEAGSYVANIPTKIVNKSVERSEMKKVKEDSQKFIDYLNLKSLNDIIKEVISLTFIASERTFEIRQKDKETIFFNFLS